MFSKITLRLLLPLCLMGMVSAHAASVVFTATGSFTDNSTLSGTVTIDTTAGSATAVNIVITTPAGFTVTFVQLQTQFVSGTYTVVFGQNAFSYPTFTMTLPVNNLVGYAGGAMNTTLSNYSLSLSSGNIALSSGSLTVAPATSCPDQSTSWWFWYVEPPCSQTPV